MKNKKSSICAAVLAVLALGCPGRVWAQSEKAKPATHPFHVPERAVILNGDSARLNDAVYAVFYSTE
ncbi:MAG: hypothetical protein K2F62_00415, partial [Muribaculaceae bacterium]|nr:hypothetical protein [Muribaculaceae bacterium]